MNLTNVTNQVAVGFNAAKNFVVNHPGKVAAAVVTVAAAGAAYAFRAELAEGADYGAELVANSTVGEFFANQAAAGQQIFNNGVETTSNFFGNVTEGAYNFTATHVANGQEMFNNGVESATSFFNNVMSYLPTFGETCVSTGPVPVNASFCA